MGASRGGRKERAGIVYRLTLQTKHESPFEAAPVSTLSCTEEWITLTLRTYGSLEGAGSWTGAGLRQAIAGTHRLCISNVVKLDKERGKHL